MDLNLDLALRLLNASADALNLSVFVLSCIVVWRFRAPAFQSLKALRQGRLHELPPIEWFLCGIWWMAMIYGFSRLVVVVIGLLPINRSTAAVIYDLNHHLIIGTTIALIVSLTSATRINQGPQAASVYLIKIIVLMVLTYILGSAVFFFCAHHP